jgi:hypothetical protein
VGGIAPPSAARGHRSDAVFDAGVQLRDVGEADLGVLREDLAPVMHHRAVAHAHRVGGECQARKRRDRHADAE